MKKLTYILILLIILANSLFTENVKVEPIKLNYYKIEQYDNELVLLADYGFISIYNLKTKDFEHIKIFPSGRTLNIFSKNEIFYAINENGEIASSNDYKNWDKIKKLNNKLIGTIQVDNGFVFRDSNSVFITDNDFQIKKIYKVTSPKLNPPIANWSYKPDYTRSMCFYKNNIIVESDSNRLLKFNTQLELEEEIDLRKTSVYDTTLKSCQSNYILLANSENLYINIFQVTNKYKSVDRMFETNDLINFKLVNVDSSFFGKYRIIKDSLYTINLQDSTFIDSTHITFTKFLYADPYFSFYRDFIINESDYYLAGRSGALEKVNKENRSIEIINETYHISPSYNPIILDDTTAIFLSGSNYYNETEMYPFFYKTNIKENKYNSIIKKNYPGYNPVLKNSQFYLMKIDSTNFTFSFLGVKYYNSTPSSIFYSYDTLKTFTIIDTYPQYITQNYSLQGSRNVDYSNLRLKIIGNLQYWFEPSRSHPSKTEHTSFRVTDLDFKNYWCYLDSNKNIDYVYFRDTNNFVIHYSNLIDTGRSEIAITTDRGASWEYIHKYEISDTLRGLYDIQFKAKDLLILFHSNSSKPDTSIYMDVYLPEDNKFSRIKQWKKRDFNTSYINFVSLGYNNKIVNMVVGDTLFYIEDLFDFSKWRYRLLQNNGYINGKLTMWGDKLICYYQDDSTEKNFYIISFPDTTLMSVEGNELDKRNYFYSYDVYPNPAKEKVTANIYWDKTLDINNSVIGIYDIYGNKIESQENIEIIQESDWTGKLTWNCSGVPTGTYFIRIQYGTEDRVIKLLRTE